MSGQKNKKKQEFKSPLGSPFGSPRSASPSVLGLPEGDLIKIVGCLESIDQMTAAIESILSKHTDVSKLKSGKKLFDMSDIIQSMVCTYIYIQIYYTSTNNDTNSNVTVLFVCTMINCIQ